MKDTCPNCGHVLSKESDRSPSFCAGCGADLKSVENTPANRSSFFPTVLLTSLVTAIIVCAILAGGFFLYSNFDRLSDLSKGLPIKRPKDILKVKEKRYVQASEITRIELRTEKYLRNTAANLPGALQMLGNISLSNAILESEEVAFSSDGRASKQTRKSVYDRDAKLIGDEKTEFTGAVTTEQFRELAGLIIEKDFFNLDADESPPVPLSITTVSVKSSQGDAYLTAHGRGPTSATVRQLAGVITDLAGKIDWKLEK